MAKIGKTCLTEEALAPIGGSRSKYLFFFSLVTRAVAAAAAAAAQCIEFIIRFNKVSRIRMHPHRKEKQCHTRTAKPRENSGASLFSKSLLENLKGVGWWGWKKKMVCALRRARKKKY